MKIPASPPNGLELFKAFTADGDEMLKLLQLGRPVDAKGRYLHWDDMRRRTPPEGLNHEAWWFTTSVSRSSLRRSIPLTDTDGESFSFSNIDQIQEAVHRIDQQASGRLGTDDVATSLKSSDRYLVSSLVEESIRSSQLEGASTTRRVAKELLQTGRAPRDRGEQMIANNYEAMQFSVELASSDEPLTPDAILELHRIVSTDALDDARDVGRLQSVDDERVAVTWHDGTVLHRPPPASELETRLARLCDFANGEEIEGFLHPVIRAIIVHFWLAYDHPFADGNGRAARALFYWAMLKSGYWLTQYISISNILHNSPSKYARSYLLVETDSNDLTYFIIYQLEVIRRAIDGLEEYLSRKISETRNTENILRGSSALNHRQIVIVGDAIRDPQEPFTIQAQARRHGVTYPTARTDLLGLERLGLFRSARRGRKIIYRPVDDLSDRLSSLE